MKRDSVNEPQLAERSKKCQRIASVSQINRIAVNNSMRTISQLISDSLLNYYPNNETPRACRAHPRAPSDRLATTTSQQQESRVDQCQPFSRVDLDAHWSRCIQLVFRLFNPGSIRELLHSVELVHPATTEKHSRCRRLPANSFYDCSNFKMTTRTRGPLKASYDSNLMSRLSAATCITDNSIGVEYTAESDELRSTPVLRALVRSSRCSRRDTNKHLSSPVPASSYGSDNLTPVSPVEDLRHHFPIRGHCGKRPMEILEHVSCRGKQRRCDYEDEFSSTDQKPILTMGAFVKAHPRYYRRHSTSDPTPQADQDNFTAEPLRTSLTGRLSPICPVPMPDNFPSNLPASCTMVSLPWEAEHSNSFSRVSQCSTETQTSPLGVSGQTGYTGKPKKQSRSKRQSSGSIQVFDGLRKTFGNLRRAISAERLQRQGRAPEPNSSALLSKDVESIRLGSFRSSKTRYLPFGSRGSSLRLTTGIGLSTEGCTTEGRSVCISDLTSKTDLENIPPEKPMNTTSINTDMIKSTCFVTGKYPDGSFQVVLRRASTMHQFGFFIARDSQGIHISRLGSVRCAVKFWDIFHVGDRILEVQGVPCQQLTVDDVQNLIRGCELVEFRIRPARSNHLSD